MSYITIFYSFFFYIAVAVLLVGVGAKVRQYWVTPQPLKIVVTPAPLSRPGVALRMAREVVLFESLFKSNKWTWLFGMMFHAGLLAVLLRHLRYFTEPVWSWVVLVQPLGIYAGMMMVAGLAGLWARRVVVERIRYISRPADHLMLFLLAAIGLSGLSMTYVMPTDIVQVKGFFLGLMVFDWQPLPHDPAVLLHTGLVGLLMIVFPFSKLLHVPGLFFAPSRNQVDDAREKRHTAAWVEQLEPRPQAAPSEDRA